MATITVIDIVTQADLAISALNLWQEQLDNIQGQLDELYNSDPLPSDAEEQYNTLKSQRDVLGDEYNTSNVIRTFNSLVTEASEEVFNDPAVQEVRANLKVKNKSFTDAALKQKNSTESGVASLPNVKKKIEDSRAGATNPPDNPPPGGGGGGGGGGGSDDDNSGTTPPQPPPPDGSKPGRREKNPLGWFSSYTYQISLYMCSPQGYNQFITNGKKALPPDGQYFIIAQSGGMDKTKRAPNMPYDYYIDNLRMKAAVGVSENQSTTFTYELDFQIIEPYGFSLPTKLKQAGEELIKRNANNISAGDISKLKNQTKQVFIIGIRFFGYDSQGNIMSATNEYDGGVLDPAYNQTSSQGLFERFFDIQLTTFKFKIEGKAVTYDIKGAALGPIAASGLKRGILLAPFDTQGATVKDMFDDLIDKLNKEQEAARVDKKLVQKNNYSIDYNVPGLNEILGQSMLNPEDITKYQWPFSEPKNVNDVNPAIGDKGGGLPNNTQKTIKHAQGQPILQVINKIIMQSNYLRDALSVVYVNKLSPNQLNEEKDQNRPNTKKTIKWYNCSPELSNPRWDSEKADWAYDIKYIIKPYETPVVASPYADILPKYPGAYKRYEYWYTGKNSEIINYSQELNNAYFTVTLKPDSKDGVANGGGADISQVTKQPVSTDTKGAVNEGLQAQGNYLTILADPGAVATARITIFGDPDFLMQVNESSAGLDQAFRKYFGTDGYSINPTSGQVFIEISFKEPIDYDTEKGYMLINDNILFWDYPKSIKKIVNNGISYRVNSVQSTFNGGKFTQVLDCAVNTFSDAAAPTPAADRTTE